MAWRIVRQPNGLLARFSDIVDNFTEMNMTEHEAIELCSKVYGLPLHDSATKVSAGVEDGLSRWQDSLEKIRAVHGEVALQEVIQAAGIGEAMPPPQSNQEV